MGSDINNKLKRLPNENELQYVKRIITGKLIDKTIDEKYENLSELIFGEGNAYNESEVRKRCYGAKRILELLDKENIDNITDEKVLKELELKKVELQKERIKLQTTKIELNRNLRIDSRFELLYENIKDAIQVLEVPQFEPIQPSTKEKEYVMIFSDVHYGSTFKSITNEYSRQETINRFNKLLGEIIEYIKLNKVNKLKIVNGGDSLQGMLRITDIKMNDIPVVDALVEFSKLMINFLNDLSKYCYIEYYHVNSANHTELRLLNTKAGQMAVEDMEKIIVNYISDSLINNDRIFINTEFKEDNVQFKILDYNIIAMHGHQLNNVKTALRDLSEKYDKPFDYLILGHYHYGVEMSVGERKGYSKEVLVCPSVVGTCPYADKLMVGGKAMAKIHMFEEGKGRRTTDNIILN